MSSVRAPKNRLCHISITYIFEQKKIPRAQTTMDVVWAFFYATRLPGVSVKGIYVERLMWQVYSHGICCSKGCDGDQSGRLLKWWTQGTDGERRVVVGGKS